MFNIIQYIKDKNLIIPKEHHKQLAKEALANCNKPEEIEFKNWIGEPSIPLINEDQPITEPKQNTENKHSTEKHSVNSQQRKSH